MTTLDVSLDNSVLYAGLEITEVAGRKNLVIGDSQQKTANAIGRNAIKLIDAIPSTERDLLVLTGPMAVWAYLIVFHIAVHKFREVRYSDGKGLDITIAAHG